tara:strand:- start:892 stop:1173 length:282 start_codon:yes stop_codon:yes gene_type:complete
MPYHVYILANKKHGPIYAGSTGNLAHRVGQHRAATVDSFTKRYGVYFLVYAEEFATISEARASEAQLKNWCRAWKIELIQKINPDWHDLSHSL